MFNLINLKLIKRVNKYVYQIEKMIYKTVQIGVINLRRQTVQVVSGRDTDKDN